MPLLSYQVADSISTGMADVAKGRLPRRAMMNFLAQTLLAKFLLLRLESLPFLYWKMVLLGEVQEPSPKP